MTELIHALANGRRPRPRALVVPLVLLALVFAMGAVGLAMGSGAGVEPRTITLVARDMWFFVPGDPTINPRLVVERGEEIRFVIVNDDPGMAHDLALPSLGEKSPVLRKAGISTALTLRMPEEAGEHDYLCSFHPLRMRGIVEVR